MTTSGNMKGHSMARPGKTKQLQVSVPEWVYNKIKELATKENRSVSNLIATILIEWIRKKDAH